MGPSRTRATRRRGGPGRSAPKAASPTTQAASSARARPRLRNVTPPAAERVMGRMLDAAARHDWALSVRTDSAALAEADIAILDSAGRLVARLRAGSPVMAEAHALAEIVLAPGAAPR